MFAPLHRDDAWVAEGIRVVSVDRDTHQITLLKPRGHSLAHGGPHKLQQAGKLKSRWITKAEDSQMFIHSEFHHIIERPFLLQEADF